MRRVTLTLIESKHENVERVSRNVAEKVYTGIMAIGPSIGKSFSFYRDDAAYMHTSTVKQIQYCDNEDLILETLNSKYRLKIGEVVEDRS